MSDRISLNVKGVWADGIRFNFITITASVDPMFRVIFYDKNDTQMFYISNLASGVSTTIPWPQTPVGDIGRIDIIPTAIGTDANIAISHIQFDNLDVDGLVTQEQVIEGLGYTAIGAIDDGVLGGFANLPQNNSLLCTRLIDSQTGVLMGYIIRVTPTEVEVDFSFDCTTPKEYEIFANQGPLVLVYSGVRYLIQESPRDVDFGFALAESSRDSGDTTSFEFAFRENTGQWIEVSG